MILMLKLETGLALSGLGLHMLWIAYLSSYYIALSKPMETTSLLLTLQPLMVGMFVAGLPGFGLAGVAYILSKRTLPKTVGIVLIAQGVILPLGMAYASTLASHINTISKSDILLITPQLYMIGALVIIGLGVHLTRLKPIRRKTI